MVGLFHVKQKVNTAAGWVDLHTTRLDLPPTGWGQPTVSALGTYKQCAGATYRVPATGLGDHSHGATGTSG